MLGAQLQIEPANSSNAHIRWPPIRTGKLVDFLLRRDLLVVGSHHRLILDTLILDRLQQWGSIAPISDRIGKCLEAHHPPRPRPASSHSPWLSFTVLPDAKPPYFSHEQHTPITRLALGSCRTGSSLPSSMAFCVSSCRFLRSAFFLLSSLRFRARNLTERTILFPMCSTCWPILRGPLVEGPASSSLSREPRRPGAMTGSGKSVL